MPAESGEGTAAASVDQWTTVEERLGDWGFVTPLPQIPPLLDEDGESLGLLATDCGECHVAIYEQWQASTHAAALRDLQFLAETAKSGSPRWLCLNCHIPLQNQRPFLITGDTRLPDRADDLRGIEQIPNPGFDRAMQQEAITCATCHVRRGDDGQSLVVTPRAVDDAPHQVRADPTALRAMCVRCHSPGPAWLTPTFFCWFDTADELRDGPMGEIVDCVDCHMPAGSDGRRIHHWLGGGVPKDYDSYDTLLDYGWRPSLTIHDVEIERTDAGVQVRVPYANTLAGHWLPTADPERFLLLSAALVDADGEERVRQRLRVGQRWDWGDAATGRPARRIGDNRLRPMEQRTWVADLPLLESPEGLRVVVTAAHVRLTVSNARHMKSTDVSINAEFVPDVVDQVAHLEAHYPFFTWIYREEIPVDDGLRRRWTLQELVRDSAASKSLSLEEIDDLIAEP